MNEIEHTPRIVDHQKLRRRIERGRQIRPASVSPYGCRGAEADGAASVDALIQIDRRQPVERERRESSERLRSHDQNAQVRDGIAHIAPEPRVEQESTDDEIEPHANKEAAHGNEEPGRVHLAGGNRPKHCESTPEQAEGDLKNVAITQRQTASRLARPENTLAVEQAI
ncbi:hypothetical protein FM996_00925 [Methylosinus sporium]|uniref:Uncharacterized protein n=1 Tax=Methylosinus sporium TaxID=428 RepID=A0A549T8N1_METSR|nr:MULTISPECIES: hypothetical protein [Methylosinus]MBU3889863.1 hypothetical protein [Methylosinus sp. KRF6]TRL38215.1 hypothetical protein FM996_00925 [Methylosinus sporium]